MQPFLSGEVTLAWLLITLTLLLFAAAGDEHPYEPAYRKFETQQQRSSVEYDQPPVEAKELVSKLEGLKEGGQGKTKDMVRRRFGRASRTTKPTFSYLSLTSSSLRPRSLQVLAALLCQQSLHTMNMPSVFVVGKPGVDIGVSLGGLGLGLPLVRTLKGQTLQSLQCRGTQELKYVGGKEEAQKSGQRQWEVRNGDESGQLEGLRSIGRVVEVGD